MTMEQELPLAGIRAVEFGGNIAGPYAGWILAELGAEVIKIERPDRGDDARHWGPPFWQGNSTIFHALNRNKRSVVADLQDPKTVAALRRFIIDEVDVLVQNMRAGVIDRLGFGADALLEENPRLVYCNLNAFGAEGPLAERPGYDALMQAYGGIMSVTGEADGPPVRCGIAVVDNGTGMWCAIGVLAALNRRNRTGKGGVVDASLFETALGWMGFYTADTQVTAENPARQGSGVRGIAPYQAYACADGRLMVAAPNDRLFRRLAEALDQAEWPDDPRFATSGARSENRAILNPLISEVLQRHPRSYWQEKLDQVGVPTAPIQAMDEVVAHAQTQALGILQPTPDGGLLLNGLPLSFDGDRPPLRQMAPELGADSEAIMGTAPSGVEE